MKLQMVLLDASTKWTLEGFLSNFIESARTWACGFVMLFGIFLIVVSVYQLVKAITGGGKGQPANWAFIIAGFAVGGICLSGGWNLITGVSKGVGTSIENMGNSEIKTNNLNADGEGKDGKQQTIVFPFGDTPAYIDMK